MSAASSRLRESRSTTAVLLMGLRFSLAKAASLHGVPGSELEFQGHAYAAFHLLEEAERRRRRNTGATP